MVFLLERLERKENRCFPKDLQNMPIQLVLIFCKRKETIGNLHFVSVLDRVGERQGGAMRFVVEGLLLGEHKLKLPL